jgi:TPR repeat protein
MEGSVSKDAGVAKTKLQVARELRAEARVVLAQGLLRVAAREGDEQAMLELALAHDRGDWGVKLDLEAFRQWLWKAAAAGCPEAMARCARMYQLLGDDAAAQVVGRAAYETGHPLAQAMSLSHGLGVPMDKALSGACFVFAAKTGSAEAQFTLGKGEGATTPSEVKYARMWALEAAAQGHGAAIIVLAEKSDLTTAFAWYEKAAKLGRADAMWHLAIHYKNGFGTAVNAQKSSELVLRAAEQGYAAAMEPASRLAKQFPEQVEAVRRQHQQDCVDALHWFRDHGEDVSCPEALEWAAMATELADAYAEYCMGVLLLEGHNVALGCARGLRYLNESANHGHAPAMYELGRCYYAGRAVAHDSREALRLFESAAQLGHARAQCALGYCFLAGQCAPKDVAAAVQWFGKSAEQRDPVGMFFLGLCLRRGRGVAKDNAKASSWLAAAAEAGDAHAQLQLGIWGFRDVKKSWSELVRKAAETLPVAQRVWAACLMFGLGCHADGALALESYRRSELCSPCLGSADETVELRRLGQNVLRVMNECEAWAWVRPPDSWASALTVLQSK